MARKRCQANGWVGQFPDLTGPPHPNEVAWGGRRAVSKQVLLVGRVGKLRWDQQREGVGQWDRARLEAVAAPRAGAWLDAPPSRIQDM